MFRIRYLLLSTFAIRHDGGLTMNSELEDEFVVV